MKILATEQLNSYGRRLRVRRVNEIDIAEWISELAKGRNEPIIDVNHGGGVSGYYRYPAETEGLVTVAYPTGDVVQWGIRLRASGVTLGGVLKACLGPEARPFADGRYGMRAMGLAKRYILEAAAAELAKGEQ